MNPVPLFLIIVTLPLLLGGCGENDQTTDRTKPTQIAEETLPPIPDQVTKEFVMALWNKPNDETSLNKEIKNIVQKSGVWIAKRVMGPNENEMINSQEGTLTIKYVNKRFVAWKYIFDFGIVFAALTYDFDKEKYYWWEFGDYFSGEGFYAKYEGQLIGNDVIDWNTDDHSEKANLKIKHFIKNANTIEMMVKVSKDNKSLGVAKDTITWSKELPQKEERPVEEEKHEGVDLKELELREGLSYVKGSNAPYTGKVYELYLNRKKEYEIDFLNGKEHGLYTSWYQNGQKKAETNYKDGKLDGLAIGWHENGQKHIERNYKDGKRVDGLSVEWHDNGQKQKEVSFKDGKLDGLTLEWHDNGQKKAESTLKDGELIAAKYWNRKGEPVESIEVDE